jgi:hypothetical protein
MFKKIAAWFTDQRRQLIQAFAGSVAPLFILFGFGSQDEWSGWLVMLGAGLQFVSGILSLANLRVGEWALGWAIIRGAVYALGSTVAPVLVSLSYWTEDFGSAFIVGLSLSLAALSNLVSIFTSGQQQVETARHRAPDNPAPVPNPFER